MQRALHESDGDDRERLHETLALMFFKSGLQQRGRAMMHRVECSNAILHGKTIIF